MRKNLWANRKLSVTWNSKYQAVEFQHSTAIAARKCKALKVQIYELAFQTPRPTLTTSKNNSNTSKNSRVSVIVAAAVVVLCWSSSPSSSSTSRAANSPPHSPPNCHVNSLLSHPARSSCSACRPRVCRPYWDRHYCCHHLYSSCYRLHCHRFVFWSPPSPLSLPQWMRWSSCHVSDIPKAALKLCKTFCEAKKKKQNKKHIKNKYS